MGVNLKKKCFETMQRYAVFFVWQLQEIKFAIRQQEKPSQQGLKCKISKLIFKLFPGKGFTLSKYSPVTLHYSPATAILNENLDISFSFDYIILIYVQPVKVSQCTGNLTEHPDRVLCTCTASVIVSLFVENQNKLRKVRRAEMLAFPNMHMSLPSFLFPSTSLFVLLNEDTLSDFCDSLTLALASVIVGENVKSLSHAKTVQWLDHWPNTE